MKPADVEAAFVALLAPVAATGTQVPGRMPPQFIRASRMGGVRIDEVRSRPTILVECWSHHSRLDASDLAADAYQAVDAARYSTVADVWLGGIDFTEPVEYPDPDRANAWRVQFIATPTVALTEE